MKRDELWAFDDLPTEDVEVPEWGTTVRVRALSLAERLRLLGKRDEDADPAETALEQTVQMVITCAVAEDGAPLFEAADAERLSQRNYQAMNRLAGRILRLSLVGPEAIEEAKKNSSETPNEGSPGS
jgi:hypothetical protein